MRSILQAMPLACVVAAVAAVAPTTANAQEPTEATETLRVYLDCQFFCDQDFVRREIAWVDWVRDRQDADVHVLVTSQSTGGGGRLYELTFLGRGTLAGEADTLTASLPAAAADDESRRALVRKLALGLVGHAADTPSAERLSVSFDAPDETIVVGDTTGGGEGNSTAVDDPWNFWVFSVSGRGFFNGEARQQFRNFYGSFSARRITDAWKFTLSLNGSYNHSEFELTDEVATSIRRDYGANMMLVKSLGPNWSTGLVVSGNSASFVNEDLAVRTAPAIEYNVFPYDESSRRQLTFRYAVGPNYVDYAEETIYGRMTERLVEHQLAASLAMRQPWGRVSTSIELSHYPAWSPGPGAIAELSNDAEKYRGVISSSIELNLIRGLSLSISGNYQRIHDQIYLKRGEASDQDVLLRIRQLETNYRYFGSVGLRYSFGSIFNNVVNPRFGGSGGGGFIFMM